MSHLEQLTQTDSQDLKREEICGLVKKKKNANFIINIVIYLHAWHISNVLQYPYNKRCIIQLKVIKLITEFTSIMGKIKCFIDELFVLEKGNMTHFTLLLSKITVKEKKHHYHGIKLSKYNKSFSAVEENYCKATVVVRDSVKLRRTDHKDFPVFENLVDLLETNAWSEENFENFVVT